MCITPAECPLIMTGNSKLLWVSVKTFRTQIVIIKNSYSASHQQYYNYQV